LRIASSAIKTHRRRARPARQSSAARRRPSRLPATAISPVTNTWSYNRRRLPTAETQAPDGTRSWSLTYGYNAQGLRTSETAPDNVTTTYTVNALGQTTQVKVKVKTSTTTVASNASYYPNGALKQFTYGNGITHTLTQNARQLPQHSQDGSVLDLTTTFDQNGNVAAIVDGTANARQSRSMAYDGLDRLTQVQSPMFGTASYGYDEQDNLRHVAISGGSQPRDHTYCYSTDNRLEFVRSGPNCTGSASPAVIALGYDPQGNLQYKNGTAYTFDYGNRLRNTANQNHRYDAAGRRVRTDSAGSQLQYSDYASDGRLVWQRDEVAGKRINNIYLAGSLVAEVSRPLATDTATYRYVHTDALGSPIAKTSSTGAVLETSEYEPYGQLLNRANDDRAGYTGHVMDSASGLIYMQARYYDPGIGGFLSVDPVSATSVGGNFNRYWYANNNPYRFTDPDGRNPGHLESPREECDAVCWENRERASRERISQIKRDEARARHRQQSANKPKGGFYIEKPHVVAGRQVEMTAAYGGGGRIVVDADSGKASAGIVVLGIGERVSVPAEMLSLPLAELRGGFRWADGGGAPVRLEGNFGGAVFGFSLVFDPAGDISLSLTPSISSGGYTGISAMFDVN